MENATSFGDQAKAYASARPTYPPALFGWITDNAPARTALWDVGTGSGQAAAALAGTFDAVFATDIDARQIAAARQHPRIKYLQAEAHRSGLASNCVDAVTVATALHWFDHAKFWTEVERVARPGALFCAWTYHRAEADSDIQSWLMGPVQEVVEPFWSDGNRLSWRGYSAEELGMPFTEVTSPSFACELDWTPQQIAAFIRSWSAHHKACDAGLGDQLRQIENQALERLGTDPRPLRLPIHCLAGRV